MLKKRCKFFMLFLVTVLVAYPAHMRAQDDCAQASDRDQVDCLSQKIDSADRELQAAYQAALTKMPDDDPSDTRKSKGQLVKAQTAWKAFVQANCAYVGGSEGGSNLWVSNFASRCELQATRERTAFLRKQAGQRNDSGPISSSKPSPSLAQKVLDVLAAPIPADSTLPKLPSHYAEWTEDQRKIAPRQIAGRCTVLWTMMNSGGRIRLLPTAQDPANTPQLVSDLCVTGKMPQDWPERPAKKAEISRILGRSGELGEPLSMPAPLLP